MRRQALGSAVACMVLAACSGQGKGETTSSSSSSSSGGSSSGTSSSSGGSSGAVTFTIGASAPGTPHVPLADGAQVQLVRGPQGGFHVWLSVGWSAQPAEEYPLLAYAITSGTTMAAQGRTRLVPHASTSSSGFEDSGAAMMFDWGLDASAWMGQAVTVNVSWIDENTEAVRGQATRSWTVSCCETGGFGGQDGTRGEDGGTLGGAADAGPPGNGVPTCASFCASVMDGCAAPNVPAPFASVDACNTACNAWPAHQLGTTQAGNSLLCRAYYADVAETDASLCVNMQDVWTSFCINP